MGFAAIGLWSSHIGVSRSLAESVGAVTSTSLMFLVGGSIGLLILATQRRIHTLVGLPRSYLVVCGFIFVSYTVCLALAIGLSTSRQQAVEVGILNYLWPSVTLLLSIPILGKRVRPAFGIGLSLALGGAGLSSMRFDALETVGQNLFTHPLPYGLAIVAAVLWGLYSNLSRKWASTSPTGAVPLFSLASGLALLTLRPFFPEPSNWDGRVHLELLFMSLFPTLIAYGMWDRAMRRGHVTLVVSASYAIPVLSTLASAVYLRIPLSWNVWVACTLVAAGAFLSHRSLKDPHQEALEAPSNSIAQGHEP